VIHKNLKRVLPHIVLLLVFLAIASCTPEHPQSTFDSHGPVAARQMELFYVIFWAALMVFVAVAGVLIYTVIRFRRRPGQPDPKAVHGNTKLEIAWTVAPAIVLAIIAVPTVINQFYISAPPSDEDKLDVNVTAHQWWWEFEYPSLGVVTSNEIHVPQGKNVEFTLTSDDVLHSFWVPKLAGKIDIIPGKTTKMWFRADTLDSNPGTPGQDAFYGQCAEFCGVAHSWMRFRVFVDTQDEFDSWVTGQRAEATIPIGTLEKEGAKLFLSKGCVACHTVNGLPGAVGVRGPDLTHFGSRSTIAAGVQPMSTENLRTWLKNPDDIKPGNIMALEAPVYVNPDLALKDSEITSLVSYLESLK